MQSIILFKAAHWAKLESLVGGFWPSGLMFDTTELEVR